MAHKATLKKAHEEATHDHAHSEAPETDSGGERGGGHSHDDEKGLLRPHLYLKKVVGDEGVDHFDLSVIVKNTEGLLLSKISKPKSKPIKDGSPSHDKKEVLIELTFKDAPFEGVEINQFTELSFELEPSLVEGNVRVTVKAKHPVVDEFHDGTSSSHVGDPDG